MTRCPVHPRIRAGIESYAEREAPAVAPRRHTRLHDERRTPTSGAEHSPLDPRWRSACSAPSPAWIGWPRPRAPPCTRHDPVGGCQTAATPRLYDYRWLASAPTPALLGPGLPIGQLVDPDLPTPPAASVTFRSTSSSGTSRFAPWWRWAVMFARWLDAALDAGYRVVTIDGSGGSGTWPPAHSTCSTLRMPPRHPSTGGEAISDWRDRRHHGCLCWPPGPGRVTQAHDRTHPRDPHCRSGAIEPSVRAMHTVLSDPDLLRRAVSAGGRTVGADRLHALARSTPARRRAATETLVGTLAPFLRNGAAASIGSTRPPRGPWIIAGWLDRPRRGAQQPRTPRRRDQDRGGACDGSRAARSSGRACGAESQPSRTWRARAGSRLASPVRPTRFRRHPGDRPSRQHLVRARAGRRRRPAGRARSRSSSRPGRHRDRARRVEPDLGAHASAIASAARRSARARSALRRSWARSPSCTARVRTPIR